MKSLYSQSWPLCLNRGEPSAPGICLNLRALAKLMSMTLSLWLKECWLELLLAIEYVSVCLPLTLVNIRKTSPLWLEILVWKCFFTIMLKRQEINSDFKSMRKKMEFESLWAYTSQLATVHPMVGCLLIISLFVSENVNCWFHCGKATALFWTI